ncbi:hypothetical protein HDU92_005552 [Lobulomyces angularis]|nr:hypothetical protein HDU92_005552 [Lobulomyces angularis]
MGKKKKRNFNSNSLVHNNSAFISPSDQLKNIELRNTTNELKGKLHLLINLVTVLKENNFSYDISIQPYKHGKPPSEIKKHEDGSHYSDQRLNDIVHKMHTTYNSIDVNKLSDRDVVSTRNFNPVTVRMTPANLTEVEQAFVITKINEIAGSYSKIEGWIEILECCNRIRETDMALKLRGLKRMLEVQIDGLKQKPKIFFLNPETVLSLLQNLMKFYQYANNLKKLYDHSITLLEMQHKNKRLEKDNSSTSKMMSITGAVNGNEATGYNGGEDEKTCKVVNGNESTGNKGREGEKNFKAISCSEGAGREESEDGKSFKAVSVFGKDTVIGESISGSTPQTFLQQKTGGQHIIPKFF